jgi:H+/Cl- antiporter ClcA
MAIAIGFLIVLASVIGAAIVIRSMQDFASNSPFFQTDVQSQIQNVTLMMLVPIAFGIILILYGAWPQKETPMSTAPTNQPMTQPEVQQVIQKEVVVVKIRCAYCNTLYDDTLDRCPYCGATR